MARFFQSIFGRHPREGADFQDFAHSMATLHSSPVIPAEAGIQAHPLVSLGRLWIPAFAGMTVDKGCAWLRGETNL
ncbi:hypothetical protein EI613_26135 [Azospirillum sp. 412522]|nr:hypothetical protein [Azospirillum sp. 412522]